MIKILLIFIISVYLLPNTLVGQNTYHDSLSGSIGLKYGPSLMLPEFTPSFDLNFKKDSAGELNEIHGFSPRPIDNPFQLDMRSSSYYVPRQVRDELNLIMNRPRESAFVPVLGVAFLAFQLAQKYLFIQAKTTITSQDLLAADNNLNILNSLWELSPQSMLEIYDNLPGLNPTIPHLEHQLEQLQDSKLIRTRETDKNKLYFPAISKEIFIAKLTQALADSTIDTAKTKILQKLFSDLN